MFQSRRTGSTTFVDLEDPSADGGSMKTPYSKPTDASKARLYTYIGGAVAVLTAIYLFQTIFVGGGLSHLRTDTFPDSFRLAVIADLDQSSKKEGKASWTSQYMTVSAAALFYCCCCCCHFCCTVHEQLLSI